jgi:O-antigen/teichoic acid export membrane protein
VNWIAREYRNVRRSSLARNAGWMFAGQGLGLVLQAGYFVVLARLLSSREYGIYVGATALVTICSQYSALGFGIVFLRHVSPEPRRFAEFWGHILIATSFASILLVAGLAFAAPHIVSRESARLILLVAIAECICNNLAVCSGQVFQAFERLRYTAILNLVTSFLRMAIAIVLLVTVHRVSAYQWTVAALGVSIFAAIAAVGTVTMQFGRPRFRVHTFIRLLPEGLQFSISGSTTSLYNDLDKTMLSHYGMNSQNGIYTVAYRVVDIATMPIRSIMSAASPRFFREGAKGVSRTLSLARTILKRTSALGVVAAGVLYVAAPILPHLAGRSFAEAAPALRLLCLIPLFRSFHLSAGDALTGAGLQRYRLGSQIAATLLNFGLNIWLIPRHGWQGAAWASLATDGALGCLNWLILWILSRRTALPLLSEARDRRAQQWSLAASVEPIDATLM